MSLFHFGRRAIVLIGALSLFAGCGGSQNALAPAAETSQRVTTSKQADNSWMLPGTSGSDLVYATGGCGGTCVFAYPSGQLVGSLRSGTFPSGPCSDSAGNVFIGNNATMVEYSHGGTTPVVTLDLPGDEPIGCSVDPTTGNLAVVFSGSAGNIAIFAEAKGTPSVYSANISASYCAYDNVGDLFVDGYSHGAYTLSELPNGGSTFHAVSVDQSVGTPGQVQWDGSYITYESTTKQQVHISRLAISGSSASIVGTVRFKGVPAKAWQSWIYKNIVVLPFNRGNSGYANRIGVWKYPQGGVPVSKYARVQSDVKFYGVTLSAGGS